MTSDDRPVGSGMVSVAPLAAYGPSLVTVALKLAFDPACTVAGLTSRATERSAPCSTVVMRLKFGPGLGILAERVTLPASIGRILTVALSTALGNSGGMSQVTTSGAANSVPLGSGNGVQFCRPSTPTNAEVAGIVKSIVVAGVATLSLLSILTA